MDIYIDLSPIVNFFHLPAHLIVYKLLFWIGIPAISITLLWGFFQIWWLGRQIKWYSKQKFILLAVDVPSANTQTPKAVENIFSYLAGAHGSHTLIDKYFGGHFQLGFSFEIVSINGYTQFLIYTPVGGKELVETAIYSQYPDAEITEVDDYTKGMPKKFPDDEWDVWGAEFLYSKNQAFPIKTYKHFEDPASKPDVQFKDPMSTLLDLCASLQEGEQLWYQIIITPIGFDWMGMGDEKIAEIMNESVASKKHLGDKIIDLLMGWLQAFSEIIYSLWGDISESEKEESEALKMVDLKPKQKKQVEAASDKVSKMAFNTKIRMVYIAKKEKMNRGKVVSGFVGYMKQFADLDLNNLKPDIGRTATSVPYEPKKWRLNTKKTRLVNNYMGRSGGSGGPQHIMNIEELASLWYFPSSEYIQAPMLQKVTGKKSQPPAVLPIELESEISTSTQNTQTIDEDLLEDTPQTTQTVNTDLDESIFASTETDKKDNKPKGSAPENLPFA